MVDAEEARAAVSISPSRISALLSAAKPRDRRPPVRKRPVARPRESKLLEGRRPGIPLPLEWSSPAVRRRDSSRPDKSRPGAKSRASSLPVRSRLGARNRRGRIRRGKNRLGAKSRRDSSRLARTRRVSSLRDRILRGSSRRARNRRVSSRRARSRLGATTRDATTRAACPTTDGPLGRRATSPIAGRRIGPAIRRTREIRVVSPEIPETRAASPAIRDGRIGALRWTVVRRWSASRTDRRLSRVSPTRDGIASRDRIAITTIAAITATVIRSGIRTETIAAGI